MAHLLISHIGARHRELPLPALFNRHTILVRLSSNQLIAIPLLQHRFHFIQSIDSRAHLRLIIHAHGLGICNLAPKIHFHLSLFLSDNGLNDRRSLLWGDISLP